MKGGPLDVNDTGMARAIGQAAGTFLSAAALEPPYSCIELVEYHSKPQRMRALP